MRQILILQKELPDYRIPFFRKLAARLSERDVKLVVSSRPPSPRFSDLASEGWYHPNKTSQVPSPFGPLVWQHRSTELLPCDLLVLEHAASILSNAAWLSGQHRRSGLVAFWGHGKNFQRVESPIVARWKRFLARRADWWFGYTESSRSALEAMGVPPDRITIVRNTIDTTGLRRAIESLAPDASSQLRRELRLPTGPVFCFVGRMYPEKRIGFLLAAFERVLHEEPHASLLFVGDGSERHLIDEAEKAGMPVRALGPLFGVELASVLRASEAMLIPGLVGLAVVDAFCAELPVFTTDIPIHSPEFSYVRHGCNGFVTDPNPEAFASAVISLLRDRSLRTRVREACAGTAQSLTIDEMAERFAAGAESCLGLQARTLSMPGSPIRLRTDPDVGSARVGGLGGADSLETGPQVDELRIAVITNELPPYRRPILHRLAERSAVRVRAFLTTDREPHRNWDPFRGEGRLDVEVLRSLTIGFRQWNAEAMVYQERRIPLTFGLGRSLAKHAPDVVVSGGFGGPSLVAYLYCALRRIPLVIWSEETPRCAQAASALQRRVRGFLLRHSAGVLAWGQGAVEYVRGFGCPEARITFCPQSVDNGSWSESIENARRVLLSTPLADRPKVVLYVGQLLERKGVLPLLEAWKSLSEAERAGYQLWIVGAGPLSPEVNRRIEGERLDSVKVLGALSPAELPAMYSRASLLVLPSIVDIWGLVVNEAMAGGIPALVSQHAGAAELVREGINGARCDPQDPVAFRASLAEWIVRSETVDRTAIQQHLAGWSIEASEQAVYSGISRALGTRRGVPRGEDGSANMPGGNLSTS